MSASNIIYTCPFVPAEWIAAHGFTPLRLVPADSAVKSRESAALPADGVCTYALAYAHALAVTPGAAVVFTTLCDQMRRLAELVGQYDRRPVFLLNVPKTWQNPAAYELYKDELRRLGRFLQTVGGREPSREYIAAVALQFDVERAAARSSRMASSAACKVDAYPDKSRTPLALVGGPMLAEDAWLFDYVKEQGGRIVLDATETGELGLPAPLDRRRLRDEPFEEIASAYFTGVQHPARRPNSEFYRWLKTRLESAGAKGILLRRHTWCDIWHAEAQRIREWSQLPLAEVDSAAPGPARTRCQSRIAPLLEMLR